MRGDDVWRGAVAGAIGGAVGASAMVLFNHLLARTGFAEQDLGRHHRQHRVDAKPNDSDATVSDEPATRRAASRVAAGVAGRPLTEREKDVGGPIVHHLFGAANGALYGALAARVPAVAAGGGTLFGGALWLGAAEIGLPLARLARPPQAYPGERHAASFLSHLVFGATAEAVRRILTRR